MSETQSPSGLRIVFMGTPEFAVPSLKALVEAGENVVAVITAPDKPSGRGQKLMPTPVKEYALTQNLPILQPEKLKDPQFLEDLAILKADFQVVVAFRMLPEVVWNMPPKGTINLHSSLLPQYRGAAPINWAIINGEKETGVTTFFLQHEIDTGNIIFQEKEPIYRTDNAGTLYARLMDKGAQLIVKTLQAVANNTAPSVPQVFAETLKPAPKVFKDTAQVKWDLSAEATVNLVRGMNPFPGAWCILNGKNYRLHLIESVAIEQALKPGEIFTDNKSLLYIGCTNGAISVLEWQAEGKKRMDIAAFFNGNTL
jgi:methionyl-tRNA formyltransferase